MAAPKSPFYIIPNFISPKQCEHIVDSLEYYAPDEDINGKPVKMSKTNPELETIIFNRFEMLIPELEKYYGYQHRGTENIGFEYHAQGVIPEAICDSSKWLKKKWVRTKDRDFSVVLFLSDYQDTPDFDSDYEVYGGKLEFLQHKFGFNPERGTLIVYPSSPHFINAIAEVQIGDLFLAKFHLAGKQPYLYQPADFPGDYRTWFKDL